MSKLILSIATLSIFCTACDPTEPIEPTGAYQNQIIVCNEGIYTQTSGTVSSYDPNNKTVENDVFFAQNNRALGNVLQSVHTHNDKIYLVVNNANKVEVAQRATLKELAQITGLQQPRYFLPINDNLAYISQWGANGLTGSIAVVDLNQNTVIQTIPLYKGTEKMAAYNSQIWATHTGGYDSDDKIAIINPTTHQLDTTLTVADCPHSLQIDNQNRIWVACRGKIVYSNYPDIDTALSTAPALLCFQQKNLIQRINFDKNSPLTHLATDNSGQYLYFSHNNQLIKFNTQNLTPQTILTGSFYGLNVVNNELFAARNAGINPAMALRMDLNGNVIDSFSVGIFANGFYK